MKITIIHGQNHKGSTYHIVRVLAEKLDGDIKEFFLPRDFGEFCVGWVVQIALEKMNRYVLIMRS